MPQEVTETASAVIKDKTKNVKTTVTQIPKITETPKATTKPKVSVTPRAEEMVKPTPTSANGAEYRSDTWNKNRE